MSIQVYNKDTEAPTGGTLLKKVFLKVLQNSREGTCIRVSLKSCKPQAGCCFNILTFDFEQLFIQWEWKKKKIS